MLHSQKNKFKKSLTEVLYTFQTAADLALTDIPHHLRLVLAPKIALVTTENWVTIQPLPSSLRSLQCPSELEWRYIATKHQQCLIPLFQINQTLWSHLSHPNHPNKARRVLVSEVEGQVGISSQKMFIFRNWYKDHSYETELIKSEGT